MIIKILKKFSFGVLKYLLLLLLSLFLVFPLIVLVSDTFKTEAEVKQVNVTIVPNNPTLRNFREVFQDKMFFRTLLNSIKIALITMFVAISLALSGAYAMVRYRTRGTRSLQIWILLAQMMPRVAILIPIFYILKLIAMTNKHIGLIIIYTVWALPISMWLLRGFLEAFPLELEEAALVDGCSRVKMFIYILLPVALPGILTTAVFIFIQAFNEFFFALCLIKSARLQTFPLKLNSYIGIAGRARGGMVALASLVATLPGLVVFAGFQKYFVIGLTAGAVKE